MFSILSVHTGILCFRIWQHRVKTAVKRLECTEKRRSSLCKLLLFVPRQVLQSKCTALIDGIDSSLGKCSVVWEKFCRHMSQIQSERGLAEVDGEPCCCDFHTPPSPGFTDNGPEKRTFSVGKYSRWCSRWEAVGRQTQLNGWLQPQCSQDQLSMQNLEAAYIYIYFRYVLNGHICMYAHSAHTILSYALSYTNNKIY